MNKLHFSLLAAAALMLGACSDSDQPQNPVMEVEKDNVIGFNTYIERPTSRSQEATYATVQADGFGVMASSQGDNAWTESTETNFMYNQQVSYNGTKWVYSPLKYWPAAQQDKLSFFAYAPYTSSADMDASLSSTDRQKSCVLGVSNHLLSFQVGQDVMQQKDLLSSYALDKTSSVNPVNLAFTHALCRIGFKVSAWEFGPGYETDVLDDKTTVTINAISLSTLNNRAQFNIKTGLWNASTFAEVNDYGYALTGSLLKNTTINAVASEQGRQVNADNAYLMILPQMTGSDNILCLMIDYTVSTVDENFPVATGEPTKVITTRNKIYRFIKSKFQSGNSYNIHIHLGMNGYNGENNPDVDNDPTGDKPEPFDPNEGDGPEPSLPGKNNFISFTATVSAWGDPTEVTFPLVDND